MGAQPAAKFAGQEAGLAVILQNVTGKTWPALVLSAGAVISVFSVTLVTIYGQTRILYTISRDGLIPKIFHHVNARTRTPVANTLIVGAVRRPGGRPGRLQLPVGHGQHGHADGLHRGVDRRAGDAQEGKRPTPASGGFRVPFGPYVVPALSIFACLYIMKDLSAMTFRIFFIWMAAALSSISSTACAIRA